MVIIVMWIQVDNNPFCHLHLSPFTIVFSFIREEVMQLLFGIQTDVFGMFSHLAAVSKEAELGCRFS